jgi:hypothetical protein
MKSGADRYSQERGTTVQVLFNNLPEVPYVMGLVRQAFEKQMGNGATEG